MINESKAGPPDLTDLIIVPGYNPAHTPMQHADVTLCTTELTFPTYFYFKGKRHAMKGNAA
jgi:hypothetical protein